MIARELRRARDAGRVLHEGSSFVFPARGPKGHMVRFDSDGLDYYGNSGRHTFRTVAEDIRNPSIDPGSIRLLMGHSLHGVSEGYITRELLAGSSRLRWLYEMARDFVKRDWPAISRVACALISGDGTLSAAQCYQIIGQVDHEQEVAARKANQERWRRAEAEAAQLEAYQLMFPTRPPPSVIAFALRPWRRRLAELRRRWLIRAL